MGQSIFGLGVMVGPSLGPTLGGWITDTYSWRWIFYVNLPLGALATVLCAIYLHDPPHLRGAASERTTDYWGIALLIAGIGCLQTLLERGHRLDWFASPTIVALAIVAGLSLVAFVARELTTEHPAVDLRALRHANLAIGCILGSVVGAGLYGAIFLFPLFSQSLLGWTAWQCGMSILPSALAMAASMFLAGRLATRFGPRPLLFSGMCVFVTSLWFMTQWTHLSGADEVFWPQVGRGIALGAMFVPLSMVALRSLPLHEIPNAAGLYNLSRQLGGSFGVALLGTLVDHRATIHRAQLGEHVSAFDPVVWERMSHLQSMFAAGGLDAASALEATLHMLDRSLHVQAQMLAFADGYRSLILLGLLSLPLMALVRRKSTPAGPTSTAEATEAALHVH